EVALAHEREAGQLARQQAHLRAGVSHLLLAHFLEAHGAVEQHGLVVAWFEEDLAGQKRHTYLGIALYIAVEDPAQPMSTGFGRDHDAIDVHEAFVMGLEPSEIGTGVFGILAHAEEETE